MVVIMPAGLIFRTMLLTSSTTYSVPSSPAASPVGLYMSAAVAGETGGSRSGYRADDACRLIYLPNDMVENFRDI